MFQNPIAQNIARRLELSSLSFLADPISTYQTMHLRRISFADFSPYFGFQCLFSPFAVRDSHITHRTRPLIFKRVQHMLLVLNKQGKSYPSVSRP